MKYIRKIERVERVKFMSNWEEYVRTVEPYVPGEQPNQPDMIKLNTNENPYPPAPGVVEALKNFDTDKLRLYPEPTCKVLVDAIADYYGIRSSQVFTGVGSDDVLAMIFMTFFNSKKPILFPDITYSFYDVWADMLRIPYEMQPLDENLHIRKEDYYRDNGGVIFPNPNAPTGVLQSLEDIEDIIKHNQDVIVIVDEAYIDFGGRSALPFIEKYDNVVIVQTFSKSRSMAGARIGYAMANEKLIRYLNDVKYSFNSYTMNAPAIALGVPAVKDREYFEKTVQHVIATRERVKVELKALGFVFEDSMSNFLFVTHPEISMVQLFADLRKEGIIVRHFDKPERIREYLRITIGTDAQMDTLLSFLREYLEK